MPAVQETIEQVRKIDVDQYKYGFETLIESDKAPKGLNEDIIRFISAKKDEPEWMLEWRLGAYRRWLTMDEPTWARVDYPKIDFRTSTITPRQRASTRRKSLDEVAIPNSLRTYERARHSARNRKSSPVCASRASRAISTARRTTRLSIRLRRGRRVTIGLGRHDLQEGSPRLASSSQLISEAIREHPDLVKKWHLGSVVPTSDNYYATLIGRVHRRSFVFVPKGVAAPWNCRPISASTREEHRPVRAHVDHRRGGAYVSYLEGCTRPQRDEQLHAAVVELIALDDAEISIRRSRTGIPATPRQGRGSTISSPSAATAAATAPRFRGPRSRPARRSPGNIRPASCAATTAAASSIRSLCRTATSRSISGHQDDPSRQEHVEPHHLEGHLGRQFE